MDIKVDVERLKLKYKDVAAYFELVGEKPINEKTFYNHKSRGLPKNKKYLQVIYKSMFIYYSLKQEISSLFG